jgi:hypothetical protein
VAHNANRHRTYRRSRSYFLNATLYMTYSDKKNLLAHALELPGSPIQAILFASRSLSDKKISALRDKALQDAKKLMYLNRLAQVVLILGAFGLVVSLTSSIKRHMFVSELAHSFASVMLSVVVGFIVKMFYDMFAVMFKVSYDCSTSERIFQRFFPKQFASLLAPAADTDYCEVGARALRMEGQNAKTWRDVALQERSQLYVFDVEIMNVLAQAEASERIRLSQLKKKEEDCRLLHGLAI